MIISQTPLRISISGGGTDLKDYYEKHEGFVVSTAIDKYVYVIVKERFDEYIYVNYMQKEIVESFDELKHELVREAARKAGLKKGVEITMLADIPSQGSGLGSSSSLTVGLLNAFYNYMGEQVTAERLAREACEIEIDILKKPIGKQDQYIAAYGGLSTFKFKKDDTVEVEKLNLEEKLRRKLGANLLLFYTDITRKSSSVLTKQKSLIPQKLKFHNRIKELAYEVADALKEGHIDKVGVILKENWEMKKQLAPNVSNEKIEKMYARAINAGAIGGKISGAGGGGFLMVYCPRDKQDVLREAMSDYRELPFMLEPYGSRIIFDYRR
jgi:D-glycero-alpha-D-manno-heptose-7-phosphate kinase